jgi:enamine deaminase RidA (YjgF/YER057c/UK114 family)
MADIATQTREALERIDRLLAQAGSSKARILTAQVRLADGALREAHDAVWNEWLQGSLPPLRSFVVGALRHPELLVEIEVTAVR